MKRAVILVCVLSLLTASVFAQVQGGNTKVENQPVTIEFWHALTQTQGGPLIKKIVENFNATNNKGITVTEKFCADFYLGIARDLQAAVAAGIYPGVSMVGYQYLNYFAENFPQMTSIDEIQKKFPADVSWIQDTFESRTLDLTLANNGKVMGLPYCASQAMLYINNDIFRAAGLDPSKPPRTWDEVYQAAVQIQKKTGIYGIYLGYPLDTFINDTMLLSNGVKMYKLDDKGVATATFNTPEAVEVWKKFQQFYTSGASINMGFEEASSAFCAGKFGMNLNTCARLNQFSKTAKFELSTTTYPIFDEKKELKSCVAGNFLAVIAENDLKKKAAWEFIKYMFSPDNAANIVIATGYVPVVKNLSEKSTLMKTHLENTPLLRPALTTFQKNAVSWTSWPGANGLQVSQILIDMKDAISNQKSDVTAALANAEKKVNGLLKR